MSPTKATRRPKAEPAVGRRTSLKHIAALTGFSITTVSMVLNGRSEEFNISPETRDLILAAAKEHNYQPNLHARSLRNRTTNILGLVVPTLENRFFGEMAETFERLARRDQKIALITAHIYDRQEEQDIVNYFLSQNVECVFTANPAALDEVSALCSRAGARHILLDAQPSEKHTVATDNVDASAVLTRTLLGSLAAAGRKGRVYFLGGMADHAVSRLRLSGFKSALQERGLRFAEDQLVETVFDSDFAYRKVELLFRNRDDIGGVFVNSMPAWEGLVRYFGEAPETLRPVHYGVFDYHPMMNLLLDLHLAAIKQNPQQMMQKAYEIFAAPEAHRADRMQLVPYELILTPAMRRLFPEQRALRTPGRHGARG
ncbi:MAG TPA: LacI family DNA-binding transcriptional regulator [Anaeromyxobacter sp.]|nr:LacI family DNA-binding transcriptional regulator [Anaeromyxobacter sp.]